MSFALRHDESRRKGIRRIIGTQLDGAQESLSDSNRSSLDERIHSVRKRFKRVRAVVRLVRDAIGESDYQTENESFRDAGRPLSAVRDAKVLLEALDKLKDKSGKEARRAPFRQARRALVVHQRDVHSCVLEDGRAFSDTTSAIEQARKRLPDWTAISSDWQSLGKGVKRVYRAGRNAFDEVKSDATVENLHEWRKQVKYLRHQLELLAPTWPKVVGELAKEADGLGELLGEDHDLAVLGSTLASPPAHLPSRAMKRLTHRWRVSGSRRGISWPKPTRPGAMLRVESEVVEMRPSRSRSDRGLATVRSETTNQFGEVVQVLVAKLIVPRRS